MRKDSTEIPKQRINEKQIQIDSKWITERGLNFFMSYMIQRKNITLSMNLKLNLKGILGPKIENNLVPGAPTSWCDAYVNPTPLIVFGTPNN